MKNKTKLILANVLALMAVVTVLSVFNLLGIQLKGSGSIFPKLLLVVLPQVGFIYYYLKVSSKEKEKTMA
jgi:hypothetical protein